MLSQKFVVLGERKRRLLLLKGCAGGVVEDGVVFLEESSVTCKFVVSCGR